MTIVGEILPHIDYALMQLCNNARLARHLSSLNQLIEDAGEIVLLR